MQKPLALSIAVCLGFTGCQVFERSEAWEQAVRTRPAETWRDPDPSRAYAAKLHRVLADRGIEHKVVTYQFRYTTRLREEAVGTRTAVIYRDTRPSKFPWWLKDDRRHLPFWLPNGSLDRQVSFYIRRPAEIIEEKSYPAGGSSGKAVAAKAAPRPSFAKVTAPLRKNAATKPAKSQAPAPRSFFQPAASETPATFQAATSWAPPPALEPNEPATAPTTRDAQAEKLFRAKHGTPFNPASAMDRRKMEELKQGRLTRQ